MVFRRLQGIKTVYVYGQETTVDAQGIVRDKHGDMVIELEREDVDGKSKEEIKSRLETIFFYDRP